MAWLCGYRSAHRLLHVGVDRVEEALGKGCDDRLRLPSGKRPDAVDLAKQEVRELKPDNPKAISRRQKQVEAYRKELESLFGGNWTSFVDTYRP